jgi:hypothetical protein
LFLSSITGNGNECFILANTLGGTVFSEVVRGKRRRTTVFVDQSVALRFSWKWECDCTNGEISEKSLQQPVA